MRITLLFVTFCLVLVRKHRNHEKSTKRLSYLDLLSCMESALRSLGSKPPYIADLNQAKAQLYAGKLWNGMADDRMRDG